MNQKLIGLDHPPKELLLKISSLQLIIIIILFAPWTNHYRDYVERTCTYKRATPPLLEGYDLNCGSISWLLYPKAVCQTQQGETICVAIFNVFMWMKDDDAQSRKRVSCKAPRPNMHMHMHCAAVLSLKHWRLRCDWRLLAHNIFIVAVPSLWRWWHCEQVSQ